MDIKRFFLRLFVVGHTGEPRAYLGTAFPVASGGLLTCRHVVDVQLGQGESVQLMDEERDCLVPVREVRYPADKALDIAFIPNALLREKPEYLPLLTPGRILTGEDVYSFGYFLPSGERVNTEPGYFKGNIVNFSRTQDSRYDVLTLSYPIVEGLSGAPVLTYHNGPKVLGLAFGSISSRVAASEVVEYEDGELKLRETVSRIVEFGLAYHCVTLVKAARELDLPLVVAEEHLDIPGLE